MSAGSPGFDGTMALTTDDGQPIGRPVGWEPDYGMFQVARLATGAPIAPIREAFHNRVPISLVLLDGYGGRCPFPPVYITGMSYFDDRSTESYIIINYKLRDR